MAQMNLTPVPKPDGGELAQQRLGLTISDLRGSAARVFRRAKQGVLVERVERGSPGARAGIEPGDLLVTMGRYYVDDVGHVGRLLESSGTGDPVDIGFLRYSRGRLYEDTVRLYLR
jgi:S1-C subfamily serine protease